MPKPKNNGTLLQVRVPLLTHSQVSECQAVYIKYGFRPGDATKAKVIEDAVNMYWQQAQKPPTGAKAELSFFEDPKFWEKK